VARFKTQRLTAFVANFVALLIEFARMNNPG